MAGDNAAIDRSGRMLAAIHEVDAQTSRHDLMPAEFAAQYKADTDRYAKVIEQVGIPKTE